MHTLEQLEVLLIKELVDGSVVREERILIVSFVIAIVGMWRWICMNGTILQCFCYRGIHTVTLLGVVPKEPRISEQRVWIILNASSALMEPTRVGLMESSRKWTSYLSLLVYLTADDVQLCKSTTKCPSCRSTGQEKFSRNEDEADNVKQQLKKRGFRVQWNDLGFMYQLCWRLCNHWYGLSSQTCRSNHQFEVTFSCLSLKSIK